jgi:repressor of nif and glnA expression
MAKTKNRDLSLAPTIIEVLNESPVPLKALSINFKVNEKVKRIVSLNSIKNQLKILVEERKVIQKSKSDSVYYWTRRIK